MPKLTVQNLAACQVEVAPGQTLLQALQANGIEWMYACGGKGRCTTCRLVVRQGQLLFGPLTAGEAKYRHQGRLAENERLACQSTLAGDAVVEVPPQTRLPHIFYTD